MDGLDTEEVEGDSKSLEEERHEHEVIGLLLQQEGEEGEEAVTVNLDSSGMVIMPSGGSTAQDEDDITIVTEGHTLSSLPAEPLAEGSIGGSPGAGIDGDAMRVDTEEGESSVASEEGSPQVKLEVVSDENLEGSNLGTIPVSSIGGAQCSIQNIGLGLQSNQAISVGALQAYTLPDGTTAFLQQPLALKGEDKSLEGQAVQLPDGITAIVQNMTPSEKGDDKSQLVDVVESPFIQAGGKGLDGIHAVQLEDGTMAYLTSAPLFDEHGHLDPQAVALEQLSQQTQQELETDQTSSASVMPGTSSSGQKRSGGVLGLGGPRTAIKGSVQNLLAAAQASPEDRIAMASRMEKLTQLNSKAYKCTYEGCERLYTTQHHLRVHQRSHTGDRPFKCEFAECGKAFATGYGLKSHIRVHTGEKPYKCPEGNCGKAFKTSGDLQKHIRIHTGERPFKCPFAGCFRSFTTSNIRKVHIRTHTGERPYICEEEGCRKAFASATNYKNHIRIHTGEKPYVCTVQGCGKRFTEYSSLYKHHVVHTHSKPYACTHCGKTYRQTSTLAMHRRTAHGEDITTDADGTLVFGTQEVTLSAVSKEEGGEGSMKTVPVRVQLMQASIAQGEAGKELVIAGEEQTGATVSNPEGATSEASSLTLQSTGSEQQQQQIVTVAQPQLLQHLQAQTITLTGDINNANGQQIYVVTDPAQLEALQQLAAQQQQQQQQQINMEIVNSDENNQVNTAEESDLDSSIQEGVGDAGERHQIITLVNTPNEADESAMSEDDKLAAAAAAAKNGKVVFVSK